MFGATHPTLLKWVRHKFDGPHREFDDYILQAFREEFAKTGEWDTKALSKLTPEDFKRYIDNIAAGRHPFKGKEDKAIAKYIKEFVTPKLQRPGMATESVEEAIKRGRRFQRKYQAEAASKAAAASEKAVKKKVMEEVEKAVDKQIAAGKKVDKSKVLKQAERELETELEEAAKEAKRSAKLFSGTSTLVRNVLKVIPGVGIVVTIVFGAKSVEAKGVEAGTIDIVLDQTPLVGEVKLVVEIVTGKDIVPDYEYINPNPPHPSEGFKPHSEMWGPERYQDLPGENQLWWDLFGMRPDVDENGFGPSQ